MAGVVVIMPGSPGPRVVTVNDLLDGQVVVDIECLDRNSGSSIHLPWTLASNMEWFKVTFGLDMR
jgi:hypothetical protein